MVGPVELLVNFISELGALDTRGLDREQLPLGLLERHSCDTPTEND